MTVKTKLLSQCQERQNEIQYSTSKLSLTSTGDNSTAFRFELELDGIEISGAEIGSLLKTVGLLLASSCEPTHLLSFGLEEIGKGDGKCGSDSVPIFGLVDI